jgi:hypothetical protein
MSGYDLREIYKSSVMYIDQEHNLALVAQQFPPLYTDQVAALQSKKSGISATHALDTVTIWWYSFLCSIHSHVTEAMMHGDDDIIERAMKMHSLNVKCVAHNNTEETARAIRLICCW